MRRTRSPSHHPPRSFPYADRIPHPLGTYDVLAWHDLLFTESRPRRWLIYLLALLSGLRHGDLAALVERLALEGETKRLLTHGLFLAGKAEEYLSDRKNPRASEIHKVITPLKIELILHLLARTKHEEVRRCLSRYVTELAETRPELTGDDLREMGFTPGPIYREILDRLLRARLDGEVDSREKEIDPRHAGIRAGTKGCDA